MNKIFSDIVIPILWKWPDEIIISEKYNLKLKFIGNLNDNEISLYQVEIHNKLELISMENYARLYAEYAKKTNILKLFCFLENPTFNNEFFIQGAFSDELKEIWRSISISWHIWKEHREFNLKNREFRTFVFWGITKINSIEITWFKYLIDDVFQIKENDLDFILEMMSAVFDSNNLKVKFLMLSSLLEFIVITETKNPKISDDSISQRFTQRLSILQERYLFYKREIDKDEEYKNLCHSWEIAYQDVKKLYDIRSCIIHWNTAKLSQILREKKQNWETFNLDFYYRRLAFLAKYAIELFIKDRQFLSLLTWVDR